MFASACYILFVTHAISVAVVYNDDRTVCLHKVEDGVPRVVLCSDARKEHSSRIISDVLPMVIKTHDVESVYVGEQNPLALKEMAFKSYEEWNGAPNASVGAKPIAENKTVMVVRAKDGAATMVAFIGTKVVISSLRERSRILELSVESGSALGARVIAAAFAYYNRRSWVTDGGLTFSIHQPGCLGIVVRGDIELYTYMLEVLQWLGQQELPKHDSLEL
jgi:hypothetical protein